MAIGRLGLLVVQLHTLYLYPDCVPHIEVSIYYLLPRLPARGLTDYV